MSKKKRNSVNIRRHSQEPIRSNPKEKNGYFVQVSVKPNAPKNHIFDDFGDIRIMITDPPEKGKANKAIIKYLSKKLKIPSGMITLVQGQTSTTKIFHIVIENTNCSELYKKLVIDLG